MASHGQKWMMVMGTRPEVIKMAPILFAAQRLDGVQGISVCTGQHRELSNTAMDDFEITPDYNLDLMQPNQDLGSLTTRIMDSMKDLLTRERPDALFVQGDTTTAFASALSAFYAGVPVYHVEAGLRSDNLFSPFPEEANRKLTGRLAKLHFAPTSSSRENLLREGVNDEHIHTTGNTVVDALRWMVEKLPAVLSDSEARLGSFHPYSQAGADFVLVTAHRRENFGDGLQQLCKAIRRMACEYPSKHFVFPVHLNPNVRGPVFQLLNDIPNVHLLEPLDYCSFIWLMHRAHFIISDSGGVQEEAATLGKPLLILRDNTERTEAVDAHCAILTGMRENLILENARLLMEDEEFHAGYSRGHAVYGDGRAAERIAHAVFHDIAHSNASVQ